MLYIIIPIVIIVSVFIFKHINLQREQEIIPCRHIYIKPIFVVREGITVDKYVVCDDCGKRLDEFTVEGKNCTAGFVIKEK